MMPLKLYAFLNERLRWVQRRLRFLGPKRSAGYYEPEERSVRRMRCLTTTLAVETVKPTPSNAENETVVLLRYTTASTNIERTISTDANMISKAAALMLQCCRSTRLVSPLATAPSTLAGKT